MSKKKSQQKKAKGGGNAANNLSLIAKSSSSPAPPDTGRSTSQDPQSDRGSPWFQTPLTSPSSPTTDIPPIDNLMDPDVVAPEPTGGNVAGSTTLASDSEDPPKGADTTEDTPHVTNNSDNPPTEERVIPQAEQTAAPGAPTGSDDADDASTTNTERQPSTTDTPAAPLVDGTDANDSSITNKPSSGVSIKENSVEPESIIQSPAHADVTDDDTVTNSPTTEKVIIDDPSKQSQPTITHVAPEVVQIEAPGVDPDNTEISLEEPPSTTDTSTHPAASALPEISTDDIASNDIMAVAELFATMKKTLVSMTSAFDHLGSQTETMMSFSLDVHSAEQLKRLRHALSTQIARQKTDVAALKATLETKIRAAVEERIQTHVRGVVKLSLEEVVKEKVQQELDVQIPEDLRQKAILHQRQIFEVRTALHNSEARRYNALQTDRSARLRPLLRPLPTPEQSPVIAISRSSSQGNSALPTPATAFPCVPAPTPIKRSFSNPFRTADYGPPAPSALFPSDLRSLFALGPDDTRKLLREYGLVSASSTPAVETPPKQRGLPSVKEEATGGSDSEHASEGESDQEAHAADMNRFMAHIGVPFLMIPPPKEKEDTNVPMSSRTRRKMLTPLIIK